MRAIVTGQVGIDKAPFLEAVRAAALARGATIHVCHVGQMMYAEAPDVPPGRILNLPITRLNALRRSVFKEILRIADQHEHVVVNTHATFRWNHGLFAAFDFDQMKAFAANIYLTLLDNVENVHQRLLRDHSVEHTLKDIMVWREEEVLATEIISNITLGFGHFYMIGRGRFEQTASTVAQLMLNTGLKRVYLSFPMSHVMDQPATLAEIDRFKRAMREQFICFDPADVDEFIVHKKAVEALQAGRTQIQVEAVDGPLMLKTADVAQISGDILGQIVARDFKMIDQSDMIVSLVPQLADGRPALSSGVERELHHAFQSGREVYVIWSGAATPSPFITEMATQVFTTVEAAIEFFQKKRLI